MPLFNILGGPIATWFNYALPTRGLFLLRSVLDEGCSSHILSLRLARSFERFGFGSRECYASPLYYVADRKPGRLIACSTKARYFSSPCVHFSRTWWSSCSFPVFTESDSRSSSTWMRHNTIFYCIVRINIETSRLALWLLHQTLQLQRRLGI